MKSILLGLVGLFFSLNAFGQNQLSGTVRAANKEPLYLASVSIYPRHDSTNVQGVITQENGVFVFENLAAETYVLTLQMIGYKTQVQEVQLSENLQLEPIVLKEQAYALDQMEVVAYQSTVESHLGKKVLTIGQDLTATGANVLEALDNIPSVTTSSRGQVQVRGNSNVVIYINGKPTNRDPSTLKFISVESLQRIELITNPSARHDAEGVGGIINLVYKKGKLRALKLEVISNLSWLTNPRYFSPSSGFNLSVSKERFSILVNANTDYGRYTEFIGTERSQLFDELEHYENRIVQNGLGLVSNVLIELSYAFDSTSTIGLDVNYDRWDLHNEIDQLGRFDYVNRPSELVINPFVQNELEDELWVNLAFEKQFQQQKLTFDATVGGENETNFFETGEVGIEGNSSHTAQFLKASQEKEAQRNFQTRLNYEAPLRNWGTLEAGFKTDFVRYDILQTVQLHSNTLSIPDNDFSADLRKVGVYALQKREGQKLEYALGLRWEHFNSHTFQKANQVSFRQRFNRFFPSAQFNYLLDGRKHLLGLNYTRRINIPGFFDLNPYIAYEDPLNLSTGNPALRPEIADLFEFNYQKQWEKLNVELTLYQRFTNDAIQSVIATLDSTQTLAQPANIGIESNGGLETQIVYRPAKWLKASIGFAVSRNTFQADNHDVTYRGQYSWGIQMRQKFFLTNYWKVVVAGFYNGPSFQIQERTHENYYLNLGINKKLKNKRGTFSLAVRDVFNTRVYRYSLVTSELEVNHSAKWQTRQVVLGFSYTLLDKKTN